ncbi:cecropin-B2-like isoform X1 [Agrilus planipennis]|uniref:Cecropin-B2-like isoform X1 n=1 Tax=Agrilus planipennis TaxID=224129 RepID=A0A7F5RDE2_AGRPL|nr:cecropin-B2-like isoform X1 [Agrilus planipennis]
MNFSIIFLMITIIVAALLGQGEARWKGFKKIEKAGKRVFKAAEKGLPVAAQAVAIKNGRR